MNYGDEKAQNSSLPNEIQGYFQAFLSTIEFFGENSKLLNANICIVKKY